MCRMSFVGRVVMYIIHKLTCASIKYAYWILQPFQDLSQNMAIKSPFHGENTLFVQFRNTYNCVTVQLIQCISLIDIIPFIFSIKIKFPVNWEFILFEKMKWIEAAILVHTLLCVWIEHNINTAKSSVHHTPFPWGNTTIIFISLYLRFFW